MRTSSPVFGRPFTFQAYTRRIPQTHRFLFYSHDGLGLGHLRRNLSIATALAELSPKSSVLLATSLDEAHRFTIPQGVDILALPGIRKITNGNYAPRRLKTSARQLRSLRASLLLAAVDSFRPAVLLADRHPLGAGGELEPAVERTRAAGGGAVLGLRDVLDDPSTVDAELRGQGLFERIAEYYDRVLVYGQPDILDACREYDFPKDVAAMTKFCGYVVSTGIDALRNGSSSNGSARRDRRPHVVATAGGGEDGFAMLATFVEAAGIADWGAAVVSGPHCNGSHVRKLQTLASEAGVAFERFVPGFAAEFSTFDALVCMGGYNTLAEAAASGVPTVCVPRVRPRTEQLIRARAFARRGLLSVLEPADLDAVSLVGRVGWVMARALGPRSVHPLDLSGAHRAARHLLALAAEKAFAARRRERIALR